MKTLHKITFVLLLVFAAQGIMIGQNTELQDENGVVIKKDSITIDIDTDKPCRKNGARFRSLMIDYGVSALMFDGSLNVPSEYDQWSQRYPQSHNWNLHVFRHRLPIVKNAFFFDYGVSFNFRRYRFKENNTLMAKRDNAVEVIHDTELDNRKSKFRTTHLELPVMLTLSPKKSDFSISVGGYGSMFVGASHKTKKSNGNKSVNRSDFNIKDFSYGGIVRVGFGAVDLYCQIAAEELFEDGVSPKVVPITFGFSILTF